MNSKEGYREAVPVLLELLPRDMDSKTKEGIVRALTVREAKGVAAEPLLREFVKVEDPDSALKWAIGNALSVTADDSVFEDVVVLVQDPRQGRGRQMLVESLANMRNPRAVDVLIGLLRDDEVNGHALVALKKLKAERARPHVEALVNHPIPWVRKEAKKALAAMHEGREGGPGQTQ